MGSEDEKRKLDGGAAGKPYDPVHIKTPAEVDSNRVSWDPEYRKKVMEALKRLAGKNGDPG